MIFFKKELKLLCKPAGERVKGSIFAYLGKHIYTGISTPSSCHAIFLSNHINQSVNQSQSINMTKRTKQTINKYVMIPALLP